jgi:hypothetical protein
VGPMHGLAGAWSLVDARTDTILVGCLSLSVDSIVSEEVPPCLTKYNYAIMTT